MKKLLALILVVSAFLVASDASAWGNCCKKNYSCKSACPTETTEAPKPRCTELVEREVCPQRHVDITYTCPEGSTQGDCVKARR